VHGLNVTEIHRLVVFKSQAVWVHLRLFTINQQTTEDAIHSVR